MKGLSHTEEQFRDGERRSDGSGRGQTNLDFVLGVSIFVIAVVFVWLLVPNLFGTFTTEATHGESLAADRAANRLAMDALANTPGQTEINEECVAAFFDGTASSQGCGFDNSDSLSDQLGLDSHQSINVTIEFANGTVMCWNGPDEEGFSAPPCPSDGQLLARGTQDGSNSDVSVAQRVVSIDDQRAVIVVRVW